MNQNDPPAQTQHHFPVTDIYCQDLVMRRRQVRANPNVNGIDYVEVDGVTFSTESTSTGNATVKMHLLRPADIKLDSIRIDTLKCEEIKPNTNSNNAGYDYDIVVTGSIEKTTSCLLTLGVFNKEPPEPLPGFDPLLSEAVFSFDVNQDSDRDLPAASTCSPAALVEPDMHYLAKDYASFRQLVLDRLALIMPEWRERHVPDLGLTLVELLAYVGDYLSYYQDAVATEAYLHTARRRISVRRHARLVDYHMHEGCNARALLCLEAASPEMKVDLSNVYFVTDHGLSFNLPGMVSRESQLKDAVSSEQYEIFEPVEPTEKTLYPEHNEIHIYTWGQERCCLPKGATRAALCDGEKLPEEANQSGSTVLEGEEEPTETAQSGDETEENEPTTAENEIALRDQLDLMRVLELQVNDVLIFEELFDPATGLRDDADPAHRHAVRLTTVTLAYDLVGRQAVLEIEWDRADALPFPLCLSAITDDCRLLENISVARGNVILVDHGQTNEEDLAPVESADSEPTCNACGEMIDAQPRPYRPRLTHHPVVFREAFSQDKPIHSLLYERDPRAALPCVTLENPNYDEADPWNEPSLWQARYDLLSSGPDERDFVVEVDDEGVAHLRFGDDVLGERPLANMPFHARYRIGEPLAGNVGAETICRLVVRNGYIDGITRVRNPLAASGGTASESMADVKLRAPYLFRQQMLRAITAEDYARLVEQNVPGVQKAYASLVASGTRFDVNVWFDPLKDAEVTKQQIEESLYPFRRIGHDINVQSDASIDFTVTVTVKTKKQAIKEHVHEALKLALGEKGFFHPDRLTFEKGISLSQLVATAQRVQGVEYIDKLTVGGATKDETAWPTTDWLSFNEDEIPKLPKLKELKIEPVAEAKL